MVRRAHFMVARQLNQRSKHIGTNAGRTRANQSDDNNIILLNAATPRQMKGTDKDYALHITPKVSQRLAFTSAMIDVDKNISSFAYSTDP